MGELDETCRPRRWRYRRNYSGLSPGPGHSPFARPPKSHPQTWRSNSAGSILHLLGQIDLFKRILTVGKSKTEGGTGREIPLNPPAYAALLKWAGRFPESKPEDYAFPACEGAGIERTHPTRKRIDRSCPIKSWRTAWRAALKRAGLQIRFHDLRHTCITKLSEGQASEQTIMAIAGHLSRRMLEHYSHIRMAAKRTALDAIAKPLTEGSSTKAPDFEAGWAQIVAQPQTSPQGTARKPLN